MNLFTPVEVIENYCGAGKTKADRGAGKTILLAILAGLFIAFGAAFANTASHAIDNVGVARMVSGLLFPVGLIMVILLGAELFTGNCLICTSVLNRQVTVLRMLRNWLLVYVGNFIGSLILAAGCAFSGQFNYSAGGLAVYTIKVAAAKCSLSFGPAVVLGIFCNVLVCAAVLCSLSAKDTTGRFFGAFFPVAAFVTCGFEHSIANMYYVPAGLFAMMNPEYAALAAEAGIDTAALTWGNFFGVNLLPVTIGNIIGGAALGVALYYGLVKRKANG